MAVKTPVPVIMIGTPEQSDPETGRHQFRLTRCLHTLPTPGTSTGQVRLARAPRQPASRHQPAISPNVHPTNRPSHQISTQPTGYLTKYPPNQPAISPINVHPTNRPSHQLMSTQPTGHLTKCSPNQPATSPINVHPLATSPINVHPLAISR